MSPASFLLTFTDEADAKPDGAGLGELQPSAAHGALRMGDATAGDSRVQPTETVVAGGFAAGNFDFHQQKQQR